MSDTVQDFDPFASANDTTMEQPAQFNLWGKLDMNIWACVLITGTGKVPFDPSQHDPKRAHAAIDVFVEALPEIDVKYPRVWECHWVDGDYKNPTWKQISLPSLHDAGISDISILPSKLPNGDSNPKYQPKWFQIARVPSFRKYPAKDRTTGQPTGEMKPELTYKFLECYDTEEACRAAYLAAGGQPAATVNAPVADPSEAEKQTAAAFLKVIVQNAVAGRKLDEAKPAVAQALTQYPTVSKFFTVDSPETLDLIAQFAAA